MRIPFLHRAAAGLYLTADGLCFVELLAFRGRITRMRCAMEPLDDGDLRTAVQRLQTRLAPVEGDVSVHLPPLYVRHFFRRGPAFDDAEAFTTWMQAQAASGLPPGAHLDDFVVRGVCVEPLEEAPSLYVIGVVHRDVVAERMGALREAGLVPLRLGSADLEAGFALAFDEGFASGRVAVLVAREEASSLVCYQDARPAAVIPLAAGAGLACAEDVERHFEVVEEGPGVERPDRLYVAGVGAEALVALLGERRLIEGPIRPAGVFLRHGRRALPLPATHLVPAALAMQQLFPSLPALDFLDGTALDRWWQRAERADAMRVLLGAGLFVTLLLLSASTVTLFVDARQAQTERALLQLAGRVQEVEASRAALAQLERDVAQAEQLVTERTGVARMLEQVGRAAPASLWLTGIRWEPAPSGTVVLTIAGATFDENELAGFLDRLEQTPSLAGVRLSFAESVPARALYRSLPVQDRLLTRFEITLHRTPVAASPDA